ncbi:cysteine--tRNA ligase [Desulfosudis oleivorans]|uniref:Cysteine--tRNA ligase n=1 Tax=Desulfosudis oleivorans (strain DSM 6200 / JCM 39069 / Hxd3) TaxID=96561 RepID=A9A0H1_DESOH|nr:cysteine--tRNA ligase [Desulfosudis oleivorans]ABW67471.1 cysteinyl-tRNA synthetase [Desulfosudis oleivorans Hxd3]
MTLSIYNVLTGKKELFVPVNPGKVGMYVCGPTVYGPCHIGHARSVVVFDVIARYLRVAGYDVTYVRNFTDVDDKIIHRAAEEGKTSEQIAEKYIAEFYRDMDALFVQRATVEPKATEHIDDILAVIQILVNKGVAYEAGGDVFFSVEAFPGYGKLSGRKLDQMEAGARIEVDKRKRNPFDFVLWKAEKPGEPSWESPWGRGRPGWHIECTAMSSRYLGQTFDIHGGGKDLIFPHHENEIAQSEAAFGREFARFWVHNGFVQINQEKMSKSLNNFKMINEILEAYHPETVRLFLLSSHYRSPIDFSDTSMAEAGAGLDKLYTALGRVEALTPSGEKPSPASDGDAGEYWNSFCQAMDDDFNTARAVAALFETARHINRLLDQAGDLLTADVSAHYDVMRKSGDVLGLFNTPAQVYFEGRKQAAAKKDAVDPAEIDRMVAQRVAARKAKDFAKADQLRKQLTDLNVVLEDSPDGTTTWKFA